MADVEDGPAAVAWLGAHGRPARLVPAPETPHQTRLWDPSPGLPTEPGRGRTALDLGCGTGRDAVFLALNGWRVVALDRLPDALDRARSLADLHGVALDLALRDLERDPLPLSEWLVSERGPGGEAKGPFDLVAAFRYLPPLDLMASLLAPDGTMIVETFTDRERARTGKPKDPSLVLPADGPPSLPEGLDLIDYQITEQNDRELATLTAKRL